MHHSYRVKFPAQAKATSSAPVRASRRARSVHMIQGNRRGGRDDSGLPLVTAIIATLEGSRVVHIRRVHSR
jgi:hypothetical protein